MNIPLSAAYSLSICPVHLGETGHSRSKTVRKLDKSVRGIYRDLAKKGFNSSYTQGDWASAIRRLTQ